MTGKQPMGRLLAEAGRVERAVEGAGASLTPLEREVLVLSSGRRLQTGEIARRLSLGERRVERVLARALRKFDRALDAGKRGRWRLW